VREYRQIPTSRLIGRLGLSEYDRGAPLDEKPLAPARVILGLKQHVGEPSVPVVEAGQRLLEGDLVAEIPKGALGARIHASISGRVESVGDSVSIVAERAEARGTDGGLV
jgi:Na+-translocating ferredoxin:NAD+ oxidoreductase RnfC subunit